jgi:heat shock protein HslJ
MKRLLLLLFAAGALASCCNCYKGTARSDTPLTGKGWQLVQMDGRMFTAEGDSFTLTFGDDGRVTGKGSANRLNGTYANDNSNGTLSFGGMASTRMMSPDQGSESRFLKLLGTVDGYTIDGRMLLLFVNGEQVLMLERMTK